MKKFSRATAPRLSKAKKKIQRHVPSMATIARKYDELRQLRQRVSQAESHRGLS